MLETREARAAGWRWTGLIGCALVAMAGAAYMLAPDPVSGVRLIIRLTARSSLALFLIVFTASAMARLVPSPVTRRVVSKRRYLGLAFAVSHGLHLFAILALAQLDPVVFAELTNIMAFVGGGLAYVFIALMVATSFDRTAAWLGPRLWSRLHLTGMWYIWLSFALNFGKRIARDGLYAVPVALILLAALLRLAAWHRRRVSGAVHQAAADALQGIGPA